MRAYLMLGACLLGACDPWWLSDATPVDAPPAAARCEAAERDWAAAVDALDASCETADDCIVLGGNASCEAEPALGGCVGIARNHLAYEGQRDVIAELAAAFSGCTCADVGCVVDCGGGNAICQNRQCVAQHADSCLPPPPGVDAGPDAR